ncbi:MAG: hypothetical protein FWG92_03590 [Leptospirales bacterium]|nr:hypothetical protein [Leptospirales bacterium]
MLIDNFSDEQLANIATLLEDAADDAYCMRLCDDYLSNPNKDETMSLEDFANSLVIGLS